MKFTMLSVNNPKIYFLVWLAAVLIALALAMVSPNDSRVMGQLPALNAQTLTREPIAVPEGLPSDRTLALVTFRAEHKAQAESWIQGLDLENDASIAWVRMPVLNDPGTLIGREAVETRLLQSYPAATERAKLVPVFTDRADFVRSANLNGVAQSYVLIVNRKGDVLARVEGKFDPDKAQILRETLKASDPK